MAGRNTVHGNLTKIDSASKGYIKNNHIHPRAVVSTDYSKSRIKECILSSFRRSASQHYVLEGVYL